MADAEAICEAAQRPTMRFVPIKSDEAQANALVFRTRDLLVRQRTQASNALRGHLMEYGLIVPQGRSHVGKLTALVLDQDAELPAPARSVLRILIGAITTLDEQIEALELEIAKRAREDITARRLMSIPGVGPITATAIAALAPPGDSFAKGRDFAAWIGLTPRQKSTGGEQKLGGTSQMGDRTLRRLITIGAAAVVRHACPVVGRFRYLRPKKCRNNLEVNSRRGPLSCYREGARHGA